MTRICHTHHARIHTGGGGGGEGVQTPLKNHKNIGFLSKNGPDTLKITKLSSQHSFASKFHYKQAIIAVPIMAHF